MTGNLKQSALHSYKIQPGKLTTMGHQSLADFLKGFEISSGCHVTMG